MGRMGPVPPSQIGQRGAARGAQGVPVDEREYPEGWKKAKLPPHLPEDLPPWIYDMGRTAEELSKRFGITREESDAFALTSHQKTAAAQDARLFKDEIIPVTSNYEDGSTEVIDTDQCPRRDTTLEKIASLPSAYREGGPVTAGNSCPRSDGAGAVLLNVQGKGKGT